MIVVKRQGFFLFVIHSTDLNSMVLGAQPPVFWALCIAAAASHGL